jgi:beta propeller repeat protein
MCLLVCFLILATFIIYPSTAAGTETLITPLNNNWNHRWPKIYGDQIVWADINTISPIGIIYLYNITSGVETQVSNNVDYNYNPAIFGNNIVWTDCGSNSACPVSTIYLYNISSAVTKQISDGTSSQDFAAISGNRIVWLDDRGATYQIYINGTTLGLENPVDVTTTTQNSPAIYGNNVVWQDCGSDTTCSSNSAIYLSNISSSVTTQISDGTSIQQNPAIYGNYIIWQDNRNGNFHVFINGTIPGQEYDLSPHANVLNSVYPSAISGNWVAWVNQTSISSYYDIDVNDTSTLQTFPVALDRYLVDLTSISYSPAQSLYRIVWDQYDSSGWNVYLYTNTSNGACPVAGFTNNFAGGNAPLTGQFTDTSSYSSSNPSTHWFWDFGDGSNSTSETPTHTYSANGAYDVSLTVSNSLCRNSTTVTNSVVVGKPVAGFTASPTSGTAPVVITFTNTSLGNPTQWNWSWGDGTWTNGTTSLPLNTVHTYYSTGTYSVSLTTTNSYGSDTLTRTNYITVLAGANVFANSTINGIAIQYHGSQQYLVFNNSTLPNWTFNPNSSVLDFEPPTNRGFQNISIYTSDPGGFQVFSNGSIAGTISSVHLQTNDIPPSGFSVSTGGPFCSMNYSIDLSSYPENAELNTQVWEGATSSDATNFNSIAAGSHFAGTNGTAYTTEIVKTNFPTGGTAKLFMSVNASLVASKPYGRNEVFVERIVDGGQQGEVLGTHYLYHNSTDNLDYFEADSPDGLSTFGLSFLEGAGNLFQLITLSVSSQVASGPSGSYSGGAPAAVQNPAAPQAAPPAQPDVGKTANLYINANNVITQATSLQSNDNLATLSIGQGIVAQDAGGHALSLVTIKGLAASDVPAAGSAAYSFAGMAYDLQPNGATFSPAVTLTFTIPEAQWGKEYTVQSYDHTTNTWQNLPATYDPSKGTISAQISHFCCFALFAKPVASASPSLASASMPSKALPAPSPPAPTAMSIFIGIIVWISGTSIGHIYLIAIAGIIFIVLLVTRQRRRRYDLLR